MSTPEVTSSRLNPSSSNLVISDSSGHLLSRELGASLTRTFTTISDLWKMAGILNILDIKWLIDFANLGRVFQECVDDSVTVAYSAHVLLNYVIEAEHSDDVDPQSHAYIQDMLAETTRIMGRFTTVEHLMKDLSSNAAAGLNGKEALGSDNDTTLHIDAAIAKLKECRSALPDYTQADFKQLEKCIRSYQDLKVTVAQLHEYWEDTLDFFRLRADQTDIAVMSVQNLCIDIEQRDKTLQYIIGVRYIFSTHADDLPKTTKFIGHTNRLAASCNSQVSRPVPTKCWNPKSLCSMGSPVFLQTTRPLRFLLKTMTAGVVAQVVKVSDCKADSSAFDIFTHVTTSISTEHPRAHLKFRCMSLQVVLILSNPSIKGEAPSTVPQIEEHSPMSGLMNKWDIKTTLERGVTGKVSAYEYASVEGYAKRTEEFVKQHGVGIDAELYPGTVDAPAKIVWTVTEDSFENFSGLNGLPVSIRVTPTDSSQEVKIKMEVHAVFVIEQKLPAFGCTFLRWTEKVDAVAPERVLNLSVMSATDLLNVPAKDRTLAAAQKRLDG